MIQPEPDDEGRSADAAGCSVAFDEIVATWVAEGTVPDWPGGTGQDPAATAPGAGKPPAAAPTAAAAERTAPTPAVPPSVPEDEHFIPPDPPPLPHLGPPAIVGLTLLVLGVILAVTPQVVGLTEPTGLPLGLLTLALGLGWLVLRSWPTEEADDDGDDDGAVL